MGPSTLYPEGPTPTCVQKIMAGYGLGCRTEGPAVFALNPSLVLQGCEVRQGQPQGWWLLWPLLDYDRLPGLARARAGSNLRGQPSFHSRAFCGLAPSRAPTSGWQRGQCVWSHTAVSNVGGFQRSWWLGYLQESLNLSPQASQAGAVGMQCVRVGDEGAMASRSVQILALLTR